MGLDPSELISIRKKALREKFSRSFYSFFVYFWDTVNQETLVENWHLKFLCDEAQKAVEKVFRREPKEYDLIINVPPGTSKSSIFSVMLEAWCWTRDPSMVFLTGSHSLNLGISLAVKSRDVIKSEKYEDLYPEIQLRKDVSAKQWYQNTEGGARFVCSTDGSPIGRHAHIIVIDDPINPKKSLSTGERDATNEWFDSTLSTRKIDKAVSLTIIVMQRLNEDDPCGYLLRKNPNGYRHICLPATVTGNIFPKEVRSFYKDGLLDPHRLSQNVLIQQRIDLGSYNYSGQFEQDPVPQTGGLFLPHKMPIVESLQSRIVNVVRSWDKAGTEGGGCRTAGVKMAYLEDGSFIVLDVVLGQWRAEEREQIIKQTAFLDTKAVKIVIEQEGGSGGKESAEATIKNLKGFTVFCDHPTGEKALRAEPFATQCNIGNVAILKGNWNKEYIDELRYFPRGKYKDQVDASSQAFARLNQGNSIDYRRMVRKFQESETNKIEEEKAPILFNGLFLPRRG